MAVGSVLVLTLGLRRAMKPLMKGKSKSAFGKLMNSTVNFGAVATTAALNVYVMRKNELKTGIEVKSVSGESMGMSKIAASSALNQTMFSRLVYCVPMFFLPPMMQVFWRKMKVINRRSTKKMRLGMNLFNVAVGLAVSMPVCCAVFPQTCRIRVDSLEPEIRDKVDGRAVHLLFNKGI